MALIPDLPAASGLSNTDLLVIDTGSQTQKIQAQNAGASASNAGLVTTGTQTFAGQKTFNKAIATQDTSGNGAAVIMYFSDISTAYTAAEMFSTYSNYGGRLYFRERSGDSNGFSQYYENYRLPTPDSGRTSNIAYEILTNKASSLQENESAIKTNIGLGYLRQWQNSAGGSVSCTVARSNIYPTYTRPTGFIVYGYEGITYFNVTGADTSLTITKVASLGSDCVTYNASTKTLTSVSSNRALTIIADNSFTFTWQ